MEQFLRVVKKSQQVWKSCLKICVEQKKKVIENKGTTPVCLISLEEKFKYWPPVLFGNAMKPHYQLFAKDTTILMQTDGTDAIYLSHN